VREAALATENSHSFSILYSASLVVDGSDLIPEESLRRRDVGNLLGPPTPAIAGEKERCRKERQKELAAGVHEHNIAGVVGAEIMLKKHLNHKDREGFAKDASLSFFFSLCALCDFSVFSTIKTFFQNTRCTFLTKTNAV
jgi:hypothetical protein